MISGGVLPPSSSVRESKKEENILKDFINTYQNGYSYKLIEIVEKSMEMKQEDRFQSVDELKNELSKIFTIKINIPTDPTDIKPQPKISSDSEKTEIKPEKKLHEEKLEEYKNTCNYKLTDEDVENAEGNYIFTLGEPSSGKTALQTAMLYRLFKHPAIKLNYITNIVNHDIIIQQWIKTFANDKKIPDRTKDGKIQRFTISFGSKNKSSKDFVKINFMEIAGEDIIKIKASPENQTPSLHPHLKALLESTTIKKYFLFVFDASSDTVDQQILFDNFVHYLKNDLNLKKMKILFIISKADHNGKIRKKYKTAEKYVKEHLPNKESYMDYYFFSLGEFDENGLIIKNFNPQDVDTLINWIYTKVSGKKLKIGNHPWWSFLKEML